MRVDIATDYYTQNMDKVKREIWGLTPAVTVAGFFLPGAAILRSPVREDDTVARLGGDEFIVLPGENAHKAELAVDRLLLSLYEPLITGGKSISCRPA